MVREKDGETQIGAADADIDVLADAHDPIGFTVTTSWPDDDIEKEYLEGMLYRPQGLFTITDNFDTNSNGELTLAQGDGPLLQPTEVAEPGSLEAADVEFDNAARKIVLDDASTTLFLLAPNQDETPPYISNDNPFRTGATGTFGNDVILSEGATGYRFQPTAPVIGPENTNCAGHRLGQHPYGCTRSRGLISATPDKKIKVASFNVLNYFTTLGADTRVHLVQGP